MSDKDRGSNYRGVSKNGKKWQVMIKGFSRKRYIGGIPSELSAARTHDIHTILTKGLNAKTNFNYTAS